MGTEERQASPEEMRTVDVDVESIDTRGRTLHGYAAVYNVESEDLGGFRERIAPGAFSGVLGSDVRALLNHDPSQVLGRTRSGTLRLFDEQRGLRFEVDLPDSPLGENVREAVRRRDIDGASFRFKVGRDSWSGELRTIESVEQLKDVTVATFGAYPAASVELRTRPAQAEEETMSAEAQPAAEPVNQQTEERAEQPSPQPAGSLRVEERADGAAASGLWDEFRSRGFPRERAEVTWSEFESRALTWTPSVNLMNQLDRQSVPLGFDQRYAWPALQRVPVDSATTSVLVMSQTARSLATASNVVRSIDAVTAKPETGSTVNLVTVPLSQVATHSGAIPNVHLEQPALRSIVEGDMQLAINEGLDKIVIDTFAASGFQAPGTDNLVASVRKAMTTLQAAGYSPDVLILRPADSEALDLLVSGISGGTADYVFTPGQPAPNIWNLSRRISKTVAAPVVMDSTAYGKLYISPIGLAAFEQNGGTTNTSILRLEGHACCGVERQSAAIRIAAA
jgi:uncharacterized protein